MAKFGGGGGIRTHECLAALLVFETSSFNHSDTPPSSFARNLCANTSVPPRPGQAERSTPEPVKHLFAANSPHQPG
jgi:hypothetical protein